jgi:hypothetical protein
MRRSRRRQIESKENGTPARGRHPAGTALGADADILEFRRPVADLGAAPPTTLRDLEMSWAEMYGTVTIDTGALRGTEIDAARRRLRAAGFVVVEQPERTIFEELGGIIPRGD